MQERCHLTYEAMVTLVERKEKGKLKGVYVIDVRSREEVDESGTIPTAINIPLDKLEEFLKTDEESFQGLFLCSKPRHDDTLVFYCLKGMRAEKAARLAVECGYQNVEIYPGSWEEWSRLSKIEK